MPLIEDTYWDKASHHWIQEDNVTTDSGDKSTSNTSDASQQEKDGSKSALDRSKGVSVVPGEHLESEESVGTTGESTAIDPLAEAQKLASENRDRWMRSVAELENYKKRAAQEKTKLLKYRDEELLRDLLPVADNLQRALAHGEEDGESEGIIQGIRLIAGILRDVFHKHGVTEIEALGKPFDPQFHEAIASVPMPGKDPHRVVEEMEKGYTYHDRLLRPAKVVVSS